jgi:hypothetical protein
MQRAVHAELRYNSANMMLSLRVALVENKVNHFMAPSRYSAEKWKTTVQHHRRKMFNMQLQALNVLVRAQIA